MNNGTKGGIKNKMIIEKKCRKRKEWIDALRAIAMIFVLMWHYIGKANPIMPYITPLMIPLFFAITGYVFNDSRTNQLEFFKNIFYKLIIPWIILTLFPELLAGVLKIGDRSISSVLYNFISGINLWYLPCLIVAEIVWFYVRRNIKKNEILLVVIIFISVFGLILSKYDILTFAMINRAFTVQFFIFLGYIIKINEKAIANLNLQNVFLLVFTYVVLVAVYSNCIKGEIFDVHTAYYPYFPYPILEIVIGIVVAFSVAIKIRKIPKFLTFIGRNTLVFYTINGYVSLILNGVLNKVNIVNEDGIIFKSMFIVLICIGCSIGAFCINRFAPWIVGKKKTRQNS